MNNVHEVAHAVAPLTASIVYVDNDPIVIAHARDMLNGVQNATIIRGPDLRDPARHPRRPWSGPGAPLDFGKPIAVLLVAVLHFIADDEDPRGTRAGADVRDSRRAATWSSRTCPRQRVQARDQRGADLRRRLGRPAFPTRAAVESLFGGLPLLPPGALTYTGNWYPDPDTDPASAPGGSSTWCGVARKR